MVFGSEEKKCIHGIEVNKPCRGCGKIEITSSADRGTGKK
jgi:hypothetical protein